MKLKTETARLAGRAGSVVKNAVDASSYKIPRNLSPEFSPVEYAAGRIATRFHLSISTAREVCRMAGIGGNHV